MAGQQHTPRSWYAHTAEGQPEDRWEKLIRHLTDVAREAGLRAGKFDAAALGIILGTLHDLGKYKPEFQDRLHDSKISVDHASAGANYACAQFGHAGRLLAHVIAAHHAGLKDRLFATEGRLDRTAPELAAIRANALADGLELPTVMTLPKGFRPSAGETGLQFAFLTRMLLSCLVDADRTEAMAFGARAKDKPVSTAPQVPLATVADALRRGMESDAAVRLATGTAARTINAIRDRVLRHTLDLADRAPGVFTLTVPTGGGKTLASLAFALEHARRHGLDRVVVVIPFTSVIEQTADVYRGVLGDQADQVLEHHSAFDETKAKDPHNPDVRRLVMESWNSRIVVTTAVQFFESLFTDRPTRCRKLHNLTRSVVVLDEAQTLPLPFLRPCVAALQELVRNYGSSVVLCTATQPALAAGPAGAETGFAGGFTAMTELAPDVPALFAALRRTVVRDIGVQTDAQLAERMAARSQALCIVNTRRHARALFAAMGGLPGRYHLSTWMHAEHRTRVLAEIRQRLEDGCPCRVVATSLIEAGVDVDFPLVLRARAGLDQVAQAGGRCNREGRQAAADSEVLVFDAAEHSVVRELIPNAEAGAEILALHAGDPLAPPAIKAFFDLLYWRKGKDKLDEKDILNLCAGAARTLEFEFETIAERMRFIDDQTAPLIVPEPGNTVVATLLADLDDPTQIGRVARGLQRYTVGVPPAVRSDLVSKGLAEVVRGNLYNDQFVRLLHMDLYRDDVGLDWDDPTHMDPVRLMT